MGGGGGGGGGFNSLRTQNSISSTKHILNLLVKTFKICGGGAKIRRASAPLEMGGGGGGG